VAAKQHGELLSARKAPASDSLPAARRMTRVVYRSTSLDGDTARVSGLVLTPRGRPPKGGWPIVTWGHGTVGSADKCAPSRVAIRATDYTKDIIAPLWTGYLKAGYAVAQTDYEGLGTPGHHPFLIGRSEARGMLDIVRAARRLDSRIGRRVLIAGHSQGGHAALWTAGEAGRWTPELRLLGTQAFAPVPIGSPLAAAREALTSPGGLAVYAGLVTRALDTVVRDFDVATVLTQPALDLYPRTATDCLTELGASDAFGGISVADMFRDDADGDFLVELVTNYVDVKQLRLRPAVSIFHGTADATTPVVITDAFVEDLRDAGTKVRYRRIEGGTHSGVVKVTRKVALADARRRLR
jgi:acetyl esterase/lipase